MAYIRIESHFGGQPAGKSGTHDCRTIRGLRRVLRTYSERDGWGVSVSMTASTARLLGAEEMITGRGEWVVILAGRLLPIHIV